MRRRLSISIVALLSIAALLGACSDRKGTAGLPTGPGAADSKVKDDRERERDRGRDREHDGRTGRCLDEEELESLVNRVFTSRSPNARSALGKLEAIEKLLDKRNVAAARDIAQNLITFIQDKARDGRLGGTPAQVQELIDGIRCLVGLTTDTFLIYPTDAPQVRLSSDGQAGVFLQGNTVDVPTLITITILPPTSSPLVTKLDQFPSFAELSSSSTLTKPAIVAVCPDPAVPPDVRARLRLGHQATAGFEITPAADASFLTCPAGTVLGPVGNLLKSLASLVLPAPVYAKVMAGGGVGGTATEFSPFGPVDPVLSAGGGVGGTATEFLMIPSPDSAAAGSNRGPRLPTQPRVLVPGRRFNLTVAGVCVSVDAIFGTPLDSACRPVVTLTTRLGTIMQNVPVGWAIGLGGGTAAPEARDTRACGAFGTTASTSSDASGKASVCWILGATPGTNTVKATPTAGGDAPAGVTFSPPHILFTASALPITPTASATGGSFAYSGLGQPGSGTCSDGLTPALSYSSGSAPVNAGSYALTVTCGAGNPLYATVTATATITITPLTVTARPRDRAINFGAPIPVVPCDVTGLLPADAGIISCTTLLPPIPAKGTYTSTPVVTPTSLANYLIVLVNGVFWAL